MGEENNTGAAALLERAQEAFNLGQEASEAARNHIGDGSSALLRSEAELTRAFRLNTEAINALTTHTRELEAQIIQLQIQNMPAQQAFQNVSEPLVQFLGADNESLGQMTISAFIEQAKKPPQNRADWPGGRPDLSGLNLSNRDLAGIDLSYAILHETHLDGSSLTNANLSYADLTATSLRGAILTGTNFTGATATGARFDSLNTYFYQTNFTDADLGGSVFNMHSQAAAINTTRTKNMPLTLHKMLRESRRQYGAIVGWRPRVKQYCHQKLDAGLNWFLRI